MTRMSRAQTVCKLAVLIAEGLSAPVAFHLYDDNRILSVQLATADALAAWAVALGARVDTPHQARDGDWIHGASGRDWHGWRVHLCAYTPDNEATAVAGDLSTVRAVADGTAPTPRITEEVLP